MRIVVLLLVVSAVLLSSTSAEAARARRSRRARTPSTQTRAPAPPASIPVEVAVGPVALVPNPPAFGDQPVHVGLQLEIAAVVDQELIRRYRSQIPAWARGYASTVKEARIRPWWLLLVPELFVISPGFLNTGMYGGVWRPVGVSFPLVDSGAFSVDAGADLDLVGLYIRSTTLGGGTSSSPSSTFVIRPGVHLFAAAQVELSKQWRLSAGWSSDVFIPQALGRSPLQVLPLEDSIWHLGGPFVMVHHRFEIGL